MKKLLVHDRLAIRFATLFMLCAVLFTLAWYTGYYLLPEGILRGRSPAATFVEGESTSLLGEWGRIVVWNLGVSFLIVLFNLLMRINGYPLGYITVLGNSTLYGLWLGTNSFALPMPERMAPSLAVLGRAGPYEMAGLMLVAAATCSLSSRFEIKRLFRTNPERVVPAPQLSLTLEQWVGLGLGIALILLAGWREAAMIVVR